VSSAGLLAALAAIALYAGMFAAGRHGAAHGLDGFDQTAIRFGISALVLLPFAWTGASVAVRRLGAGRLLALFVLGGAPYSCVFLGALVFAPVAYGAALVPGLQPLAVIALSALFLAQRPALPNLVGALVCLGGLLLVLGDREHSTAIGTAGPGLFLGVGLFMLSAVLWGGYAVALKAWQVEPAEVLATTAPLSALLYLPPYFFWRGVEALAAAPMGALLVQVAYQGELVGVAALVLYAWAVKQAGSAAVAALAPTMPVLAALIGVAFLDERPGALQWTGLAVVTAGLLAGSIWPMLRVPRAA
jgi:drug/metabolite transporter (DMT)-like permease